VGNIHVAKSKHDVFTSVHDTRHLFLSDDIAVFFRLWTWQSRGGVFYILKIKTKTGLPRREMMRLAMTPESFCRVQRVFTITSGLAFYIKRYYNIYYIHLTHIKDAMISLSMMTPHEMAQYLAKQLQVKRLDLNLSQQTLSLRSGVSYGVLKKFERTGRISFESLLKLALVLGSLEEFKHLFAREKPEQAASLDELMKDKTRKRGRQ
jgi:hypothetical protein